MKRRDLLKGVAAGVAALPFGPLQSQAAAATELVGQKSLSILSRSIEVNGKSAKVFGLVGPNQAPGLRLMAGTDFNVLLQNQTSEPSIIHWHGLTPPWPSDGVAAAPLPLIDARENRAFRFPLDRPGTHWMHAHTLQEQALLAAPLIVEDPADAGLDEQEVVVLLHDFSFQSADELLAQLNGGKAMGGMDMSGGSTKGIDMSGGGMVMDLNDIEYDAYLANDRTLDDPEVVTTEIGGRVRLRIINGAAATAFTIDLGLLTGSLVAVDGQPIIPIAGTTFPITMGQRLDIRVQLLRDAAVFPILALREGGPQRTGIVLKSGDASLAKLSGTANADGPVLDLLLESQLRAASPLHASAATRKFGLMLNGDMAAYRWALSSDEPILVDLGDRVEITMQNMSMMAHPMHLHGHHFQVVAIDGQRFPGALRDTVLVPPMRSVTIAVDAMNPGQWAFHCHHLYHMVSGMMTTFAYRA
ncbi:multicopper oxidase family protein [Devosia sp.]|uniref:multicopper oxidase family protein n=1 Tax=Devosia sp. TaxID=1871048 RepID=UPI003BAB87AB